MLTLEQFLGIFGLLLTVLELYIPSLSNSLEQFLDTSSKKIKPSRKKILNSRKSLKELFEKTIIGKFYKRHFWKLTVIYVGAGIFSVFASSILPKNILEIYETVVMIPIVIIFFILVLYSLWFYFYPVYMIITISISSSLYILEQLIHGLNYIGNKKALSGIGILLALYGVLSLEW